MNTTAEVITEKRTYVIRKPKEQYYDIAVAILGGLKNLTQLEKDILKAMIILNNEYVKDNITPTDLLNSKMRKTLMTNLKITKSNFGNYVIRLKNKGVIVETELGYTITPQLVVPDSDVLELTFKIVTTTN